MTDDPEPSEKFKKICHLLASEGLSVIKGCEKIGWNDVSFYDEMQKNKAFEAEYLRARENRSHSRFEKMNTTIDDVVSGKLNPNAGRVVLDAMRWQMAKEKPGIYGEKTINEVNVALTLSNLVEQSIAATPALSAPDVIDVTPIRVPDKLEDYI